MLKLSRIFQNYAQTGSLGEQINLFGFIGPEVFLTKSGEVGVVFEIRGVDYECLEHGVIDQLTKRLESALRLFDENCRVYQYLGKRNLATIPYKLYGNPVVDAAIENRLAYLARKAETLFSLSIHYVVLYRECRSTEMVASLLKDPRRAIDEIATRFSIERHAISLGREVDRAQSALLSKARSFVLQLSDFLPVRVLEKDEAFRFLKKLLNFDPQKLELARLKHDTFLDYYLPESHIECHRRHLRIDDYYVRVLTLKEPPAQSFPLILERLLEVGANYYVVTEWHREDSGKTRRMIQAKRRHFHNTKRSFLSQVNLNDAPFADALLDDSKESRVRELGESVQQIELQGNYFGEFSLSVVIYDLDLAKLERASAEFYKAFSIHDAQLYEETYNLLNAFLACIPGNYAFNLRYLYLLNTNYADFSFLFTLDRGETKNPHLRAEYLAVLETNHRTPYFLNLHYRDVAHTMILGRTGAGKSFLLGFLITNLQKYAPHTFIFDLGGSFESLTQLFEGSYVRVGPDSQDFKINPFSLAPTKENLDFLTLFVKVLIEGQGPGPLGPAAERDLYHQIENLYAIDPTLRTLGVLANTLDHEFRGRLGRWIGGGQFAFLFDNREDTVSFSRFQCFDFERMRQYPELLEPLLFYILHRTNAVIADRAIASAFKAFFIDEAWAFLTNPSIERYIVTALKTWRKHNAAMILSTQSLDELKRSVVLDVVLESCSTKIFLANPDMDRELYGRQFHLNDSEVERIRNLIPKRQFLIKTPELAKVLNLEVDPKSYWIYTNDPYDNQRRQEAFKTHGFERGLDWLAQDVA
jgi:type IV secretion system protein TrbE